ncbi:MAG: 23S rRNA (uracil(1939)-C(5))-methyltransferase RlmD [Tractidigestivibacter sp.]|jgi:23S rRNA (uracil1939-C5)-methyltransferase|uniref:23S rRNA (uracil(1939)-C(5))-methyltransferase RlmD n=1 Tax=Tractidigestivibacter sp. TaxID=2847320 RepID=UPI003D89F334
MGYRTYTCPIARSCGGCEWLAVPYPIQLERKQKAVSELLSAICGADGCSIDEVVGMAKPIGYRYKAATPLAPGTHARIRSGFYAQGTHRIVPCAACLVEHPQLRPILNNVARVGERLGIPAYNEDRGRGLLRHAIARRALYTDDLLLTIVTNGDRIAHVQEFVSELRRENPEITSIVQNVNNRRTNAMLGSRTQRLYGPGTMRDSLLGCNFELGATAFYQTNPSQTEALYRIALKAAKLSSGMRVLDAYCGVGTIGLCAAKTTDGIEVVGVEKGEGAVENARRNAELNGLEERVRFVRADATQYLCDDARGRGNYDVVLMDPPRAGSTPEFLGAASDLKPERIVYISCNPQTQARDLWLLHNRGWHVRSATPVDMFPHTKHIETVVSLER